MPQTIVQKMIDWTRQAELNKLIVQLFRRHPGLNYFQVNCSVIFCMHVGIDMRIRDFMILPPSCS
jgi:hypothetical protein